MTLETQGNPSTVLITGATGLLGRQVVSTFRNAGWRTVGTGFSRAKPPSIHKVDLTDPSAVEKILEEESYASHPVIITAPLPAVIDIEYRS